MDAFLLDLFPGRTLEELDGLDWMRLQRALEAKRIIDVEQRRALWLGKKLSRDSISDDEWAAIQQHDEWMNGVENGG